MALESLRVIVKRGIEGGITNENVDLLVSDLESTTVEFLDFIQSIGPGLVDDDKNVRLNATKLLSEVVSKLKSTFFNEDEIKVLVEFLCAKFEDHHLIAPASLKGLEALSKAGAMSSMTMKLIIRSIYRDLTVQTLIYNDRSLVYSIFYTFLKSQLEELQEMNGEFVVGFVHMADCERDPRNLMLIFGLIPIIASNIPLGAIAQDLFELISEYFPIEFAPGPNYEEKITRGDLSDALKSCFTASHQFADYALPLLIEKMSSDVTSSKIDSLDYLIACCEVYPPEKIAEFSERIWSVLRHNMFSSKPELEDSCLSCLAAMTCCLSRILGDDGHETAGGDAVKSGEEPNEDLMNFANNIFKDCSKYLEETSLSIFHQAVKVLVVASSASMRSSNLLLGKILDVLLKEFNIQKQTAPRVHIVKALLIFIGSERAPLSNVTKGGRDAIENKNRVSTKTLLSRKVEILSTIIQIKTGQSPDLQGLCCWGMTTLLSLEDFLNNEEQIIIMEHLSDLVIAADSEIVRKSLLSSLECASSMKGDLCLNVILPRLLNSLHSELENYKGSSDTEKLKHLILSISHLSIGNNLVNEALPELMKVIISTHDKEYGLQVVPFCIQGLEHIIKTNVDGDMKEYFSSWFIKKCLEVVLQISQKDQIPSSEIQNRLDAVSEVSVNNQASASDTRKDAVEIFYLRLKESETQDVTNLIVEGLSTCMRIVIQQSDAGLIEDFVKEVVTLFLTGLELTTAESSEKYPIKTLLHLVLSTVCPVVNQEEVKDIVKVMLGCCHLALNSNDLATSIVASKCFASLVNKAQLDNALDNILQNAEDELINILIKNVEELNDGDAVKQKVACLVWSWLTKALVARNHDKQTLFANQMVDMLSMPELSRLSSDGFQVVLNNFDEVLSEKSHSNLTLLFKQRFFALTVYRLVDAFHVCESELKKHFLNALSHLNQFIPKQVIQAELKLILPLLIQSLHQDGTPEIWSSSLSALQSFIQSSPGEIGTYLDDIIPRLLDLCRCGDHMMIRIEALKCMTLLPERLPAILLLPNQKRILLKLAEVANDRKRLVRKQTSITKCAWHLVSEPDQPESTL